MANDATELEEIPAAVFNQWQFFEDGSYIFYLNGEAVEYDFYSFEEGSSTHFTIKCNNQNQEELEFYYIDDTLFWVGENALFIMKRFQNLQPLI